MALTRTQQKLVEDHLAIPRILVRLAIRAGYPLGLEDEMTSVANLALCEAASDFDPGRGVLFRTYAGRIIRGRVAHVLKSHRSRERLTTMSLNPDPRNPDAKDVTEYAGSSPSPEDVLLAGGETRRVKDRLASLPVNIRLKVEKALDQYINPRDAAYLVREVTGKRVPVITRFTHAQRQARYLANKDEVSRSAIKGAMYRRNRANRRARSAALLGGEA